MFHLNCFRFLTEELCKRTCQQSFILTSSTSAPLIVSTSTVNVVHSITDPAEADLKEIINKEAETGDGYNTEDEEYYNEYDLTTTIVATTTKSARPTTAEKTTKTSTMSTGTTPTAAKISGATIGM